MKKKGLLRLSSMMLAVCILLSISVIAPLASSETEKETPVIYYYAEDGEKTGVRSVKHDDTLFYDCTNNKDEDADVAFFHEMLSKDIECVRSDNSKVTINQLEMWANVAAAVFENAYDEQNTSRNYASNQFDYNSNFGRNITNEESYQVNVAKTLGQAAAVNTDAKKSTDHYASTGLSVAGSLSDARMAMCDHIADRISNYTLTGDDLLRDGSGQEGSNEGEKDALPQLSDTTKQTVLYNIVTSINHKSTDYFDYSSFGVAFYDFDLKVINDENIEQVKQSQEVKTYDQTKTKNEAESNKIRNEEIYSASGQTSRSKELETSISTTIENSTTYEYGQMFGVDFRIGNDATLFGLDIMGELTFNQIYGTTEANTKGYSQKEMKELSASYTVPAHTVVNVNHYDGEETSTVVFDTPVALTFNVAVFSMGGDVHAGPLTNHFDTAQYVQGCFSTIFGGGDAEQGLYAFDALVNRVEHKGLSGWDKTYGNNYINWNKHGDNGGASIDTADYGLDFSKVCESFKNNCGKEITEYTNLCPMMAAGTTSTYTRDMIGIEITAPRPLYLPKEVMITNLPNPHVVIKAGGSYNMSGIVIDAFNSMEVPYYGFAATDGSWSVKEGSEEIIEYDKASRSVIGLKAGTGTLVWKLNDGVVYTAEEEPGEVTSDDVDPVELNFTVLGEEEPTETDAPDNGKKGDADNNGIVNVFDVTEIQMHCAHLKTLTGIAYDNADVNGDGVISITDATIIQYYLAKHSDEL